MRLNGAGAFTFRSGSIVDITINVADQNPTVKMKRGPAPTGIGTPVMVRMQAPDLAALDAWRAAHEDVPSRPEAIRLLIRHVLGHRP